MDIDKNILLTAGILCIIGLVGFAYQGFRWLMSPPKPKNNRFQRREYSQDED